LWLSTKRNLRVSPAPDESKLCVFNGLDGATGKCLTPPMEPKALFDAALGRFTDKKRPVEAEMLAQVISGGKAGSKHLNELKARHESTQPHFGVRPGIDSGKLNQAGWGILFAHDADPALKELMDWRKPQAGKYYEFEGYKGYRPGDSHLAHRVSHGLGRPSPLACQKSGFSAKFFGQRSVLLMRLNDSLTEGMLDAMMGWAQARSLATGYPWREVR
jgi:hypothetical protein